MLIKKKKKPQPDPNHRKPMTRRDFVAQGLLTGTTFAAAPSLLSSLSQKAYGGTASECSPIGEFSSKIPVFLYDAAGGAQFAGANLVIGGPGGEDDLLQGTQAYAKYGLPDSNAYHSSPGAGIEPDTSFGLKFHPNSPFLLGLKSALPSDLWDSVDGFLTANISDSDSSQNRLATTHYFSQLDHFGALTNAVGKRANASGGRHLPALGSVHPEGTPIPIGGFSDARKLGGYGPMMEQLGEARAKQIIQAAGLTSQSKLEKFHGMSLEEQLWVLLDCNYLQAKDLPFLFDPNQLAGAEWEDNELLKEIFNPDTPPNFNGLTYGDGMNYLNLSGNLNGNRREQMAAIAKLTLEGYAGVGVMEVGGYDNHRGYASNVLQRQFDTGSRIGALIRYAAELNKPVMVCINTDGFMSVDTDFVEDMADPQNPDGDPVDTEYPGMEGEYHGWPGDCDHCGAQFAMVFVPGAKRGDICKDRRQIGAFSSDGVIESSSIAANSTTRCAQTFVLNWLALHGEEEKIAQIAATSGGTNPFDVSENGDNPYIRCKKVIG